MMASVLPSVLALLLLLAVPSSYSRPIAGDGNGMDTALETAAKDIAVVPTRERRALDDGMAYI